MNWQMKWDADNCELHIMGMNLNEYLRKFDLIWILPTNDIFDNIELDWIPLNQTPFAQAA